MRYPPSYIVIPPFKTQQIGVATATSINKVIITQPATTATLTLANNSTFATSGAFSLTLTATAATNVTLPTTGTLATLAGVETLSNKTLSGTTTILGNTTINSSGSFTTNINTGTNNGLVTIGNATSNFGMDLVTLNGNYTRTIWETNRNEPTCRFLNYLKLASGNGVIGAGFGFGEAYLCDSDTGSDHPIAAWSYRLTNATEATVSSKVVLQTLNNNSVFEFVFPQSPGSTGKVLTWNASNETEWATGASIASGGSLSTSGAYGITFTATGTTNVTLPTSGTLATQAYADALVVGLWDDRGSFDASVNAYPSSGGSGSAGAILKGDMWTVSVAGTLPTAQPVEVGDIVRALQDTPGNTQTNWAIQQNNIGYTAENSANKDTDGTLAANSDTKYASQKAVRTYISSLAAIPVNKIANQTVNNSTVLVNDNHFSFPIGVSQTRNSTMYLKINSVSSAGFKCAFTVPAGCTGFLQWSITDPGGGTNYGDAEIDVTAGFNLPTIGNIDDAYLLTICAYFINSTTAGTIQFQWAQVSEVATDTIVRKSSIMQVI